MSWSRIVALIVIMVCLTSGTANTLDSPTPADPTLQKVLADYIDLYARETLPQWRKLFHEGMTVANLKPDGSINVRNLDAFYAAQESYFATGRRISERLENISIASGNYMATVTADFIFIDDGEQRRGKLGLHFLQQGTTWKIVAVVFTYF